MGLTIFLLCVLGFVVLLALRSIAPNKISTSDQATNPPYYKNHYFLSHAELSFFKVLEQAVGDTYYILPQVNLASLVKVNARGRDWWIYFEKINRKSVDYVLAEKSTCNPVLVIELNDSSHNEDERQRRDLFVKQVLESAHIPILTVLYKNGYGILQLREQIAKAVGAQNLG